MMGLCVQREPAPSGLTKQRPNPRAERKRSTAARQPLGFALLQITHTPGRQGLRSLKTYPPVFIIETSCPIC